jgi:hypothetical protein
MLIRHQRRPFNLFAVRARFLSTGTAGTAATAAAACNLWRLFLLLMQVLLHLLLLLLHANWTDMVMW